MRRDGAGGRMEGGVAALTWHGAPGSDHLATPHGLRVFCDCIRGPWRGGQHNNSKEGLGSCCCMWGASMEGAEMWLSLSCGVESL